MRLSAFRRERLRIIGIIALASIPLVGLEAVILQGQQQAAQEGAQTARLALARAAAVDANRFVAGNLSTLTALSQTRSVKGADSATANAVLAPIVQSDPSWMTLGLSNAKGLNISSLTAAPGTVNVSDRDYFQAAMAGKPGVGSVISPRGNLRTKTIVLAVPVTFTDGSVGVLSGALNLNRIEDELRRLVPAGSVELRVVDRLGQEFIGPSDGSEALPDASGRPEVKDGLGGNSGAAVQADPSGREALVAYAPAKEAGWVVILSEPTANAFATSNEIGRIAAILTIVALGAAVLIAWYMGGRLASSYAAIASAQTRIETERNRLREALRQVPARVGLLSGPDLVYVAATPHQLEQLGRKEEEVIGRRFADIDPDPTQLEMLERVYRTGVPFVAHETPTTVRLPSGQTVDGFHDATIIPTSDADGAIDGVIYYANDVTDLVKSRKRLEELAGTVRAERDEMQQVVNEMPEGVIVMRSNGTVVRNRTADELFGREFTGDFENAVSEDPPRRPDGRPYAVRELPIMRALNRGEVVRGEEMLVHNAQRNEDLNLLVSAAPVVREGQIVASVSVFQDITELRAFERQRTEFFSMASHEIRTPVTAIQLQLDLALRQMSRGDSSRLEELVRKARQRTAGLGALIGDLLDVSRLDVGKFAVDLEDLDLSEVVRRAVEDYPSAPEHPVQIISSGGALPVRADARRVIEVIENLLSNAVKYSPEGTPVTVEIGREKDTAVIRVRDEGMGVPEEERTQIFDRFFRTAAAKNYGGVGLGLYISKEIVNRLSGDITLESTGPGGSCFKVTLPLVRVAATAG